MKKLRAFISAHKIVSAAVALAALGGGYWWYAGSRAPAAASQYVIGQAARGTVVASVTGSGQVQAVDQVDVKPKVSASAVSVLVSQGDQVQEGDLLAVLDTTDASSSVSQAQIDLQSAQVALAKLQEPPDAVSLAQDQNAVVQAQTSLANASDTYAKAYQDGFTVVAGAFIDFQTTMAGLQDFVTGHEVSKNQDNLSAYVSLMPANFPAAGQSYQDATAAYQTQVSATYSAALSAYNQNLADYGNASRTSDKPTLDSLFSETYSTAKLVAETIKASRSMLDYIVANYPTGGSSTPLPSVTTTFENNLASYTTTVNNDLQSVLQTINTIASDKNALTNAELAVPQAQVTLQKLQSGADPLDIKAAELTVQQKQLALQTAQEQYDDSFIRAPIGGVVSALNITKGDYVSAGAAAATIVAREKQAQVTLNEVDAAKVSLGDKATLTFDALPDLSLAGKVVELDPVGTVSQGVVNYDAKISFDDSGRGVKPGMSVTAAIVTAVHQNALIVPNSAVKSRGTASYVEVPASPVSESDLAASQNGGIALPAAPNQVPVTVGLSNDSVSEITSGLQEGEQVILQTLGASAASAAAAPARRGGLFFGGGRAIGG